MCRAQLIKADINAVISEIVPSGGTFLCAIMNTYIYVYRQCMTKAAMGSQ